MTKILKGTLAIACMYSLIGCAAPQQVIQQFPEEKPNDVIVDLRTLDEQPRFQKGNLQEWILKNIRYPREAILRGKEGKTYVQFIIGADGRVSFPEVVKSSGNRYLDAEAVRLVSSMPQWKPGQKNGLAVNVNFTIPVGFKLSGKKTDMPDQMFPVKH